MEERLRDLIKTDVKLIYRKKGKDPYIIKLGSNKILNGAGLLLAQYCQNAGIAGLTYIGVGTGNAAWPSPPPDPDVTDTELVAESYRKVISVRRYLDATYATVPGPSQIIEMEVTFMEHEANVAWREIGLFGGAAASATVDTGTIFSARRFDVKNKEDDEQVSIAWRLSF